MVYFADADAPQRQYRWCGERGGEEKYRLIGDETHRIDQRPARHLTRERHQSSSGQNKADIELRPGVRGQIDCDERTEAGLEVVEEEREPVKAARAPRRRIARCGRRLLECRR
jgi:hypothetical protein